MPKKSTISCGTCEDSLAPPVVDWRAASGNIIPAPPPPELIPYEARQAAFAWAMAKMSACLWSRTDDSDVVAFRGHGMRALGAISHHGLQCVMGSAKYDC